VTVNQTPAESLRETPLRGFKIVVGRMLKRILDQSRPAGFNESGSNEYGNPGDDMLDVGNF